MTLLQVRQYGIDVSPSKLGCEHVSDLQASFTSIVKEKEGLLSSTGNSKVTAALVIQNRLSHTIEFYRILFCFAFLAWKLYNQRKISCTNPFEEQRARLSPWDLVTKEPSLETG